MKKLIALAAALSAAPLLVLVSTSAASPASRHTETYSFKATMTAGQEVPAPTGTKATAGGNFSAKSTETKSKTTFRWTLTFRNLTGKALAAHVHMGKKGVAGAVIVPLCGPCKNGQTGTTTINSSVEHALESGDAYVNVHTTKNQGGEIRGQVKVVGS